MYTITNLIYHHLFLALELRSDTGETKYWMWWDDLDTILMEEYGVKELVGLKLDNLPPYGDWIDKDDIYKA